MDLNAKCEAAAKLNAAIENVTPTRPVVVKCIDGRWFARFDSGEGPSQSETTAEAAVDGLINYLLERADKEQDKLIERLSRTNRAMNVACGRGE